MPPRDKRALPLVLAAGSGLVLAACSTTGAPDPLADPAAPQPMPGYDWHLNQDTGEISLAYGMRDTDDVPLDLSCQPRTGTLQILHAAREGSRPRIQLESGGTPRPIRPGPSPQPWATGLT